MGREYGPWVRLGWCPHCFKATEQTRWFQRLFGSSPGAEDDHRIRCNECCLEVVRVPS